MEQDLARYRAVDPAEVQAAVEQWLAPAKAASLMVLPEVGEAEVDEPKDVEPKEVSP